MDIIFITMCWPNAGMENMYTDLMQEFVAKNHNVYVATLNEKRNNQNTYLATENGIQVLRVKCGNIQKTNKYEKVISSFLGGYQLKYAVIKHFKKINFSLIIFALPPVTIVTPLVSLKKRLKAKMYLLLKEFWPQDPVDLCAMRYGGTVWQVFRFWEKKLYRNSDYIGTMSEAGIKYLLDNNKDISAEIEVCPNSQRPKMVEDTNRQTIRDKYGIAEDTIVYIFGGNLGVSQGIDEMISCIQNAKDIENILFLIIGDGTEYAKVESALSDQSNVTIIKRIPQDDYEKLAAACDVGLIFLNSNYHVPNVPSRMVSYLMYGLPVIACVDKTTDAGQIIKDNGCGFSLYNGDVVEFQNAVIEMKDCQTRKDMSEKSKELFLDRYTTLKSYETIIKHFGLE